MKDTTAEIPNPQKIRLAVLDHQVAFTVHERAEVVNQIRSFLDRKGWESDQFDDFLEYSSCEVAGSIQFLAHLILSQMQPGDSWSDSMGHRLAEQALLEFVSEFTSESPLQLTYVNHEGLPGPDQFQVSWDEEC